MADLVYNGPKFDELINRLDQNINKLKQELETFEQNYQIVKNNWSGDEFNKADAKLQEVKNTLLNSLETAETQKKFLDNKRQEFERNIVGL